MTANLWIQHIRNDKRLSKLYDKLTTEERHRLFTECDNDTWHLAEIIEEILEDRSSE